MKHIAVVAIFGLIALNTILKPTAAETISPQVIGLEDKHQYTWPMRRAKREHMGKAQSFIDLILKIMNSLQFGKPKRIESIT